MWKNFLDREAIDIGVDGFDRLASYKLNGREIKNTIGTAKTLADADGEPLDVERLEMVMKIRSEFEADMRA